MGSSIACTHASRQIAVGTLELHGSNRAGAVEGSELRTQGLSIGAGLAGGVGHELLLVHVHLALDLGVLLLVGAWREGRLGRVGVGRRCSCGTGALGGCKVGRVEARQRR